MAVPVVGRLGASEAADAPYQAGELVHRSPPKKRAPGEGGGGGVWDIWEERVSGW